MDTIEKAAAYAQAAAENIANATNQTSKARGQKGGQWLNAEQKLMKQCCHFVGCHPMASLGLAVTLGFVLSSLFDDR